MRFIERTTTIKAGGGWARAFFIFYIF